MSGRFLGEARPLARHGPKGGRMLRGRRPRHNEMRIHPAVMRRYGRAILSISIAMQTEMNPSAEETNKRQQTNRKAQYSTNRRPWELYMMDLIFASIPMSQQIPEGLRLHILIITCNQILDMTGSCTRMAPNNSLRPPYRSCKPVSMAIRNGFCGLFCYIHLGVIRYPEKGTKSLTRDGLLLAITSPR
jgi:hypothetical protein